MPGKGIDVTRPFTHPKALTGVGGLLGALAGALWSAHRQPHKPWDRGERPIMEQLDTALQTRRPAPSFSQGYTGPAAFLTDNPHGIKAGGVFGGGMDDDEKRELKSRKLVSGATQGGAIGSTAGSLAALLTSVMGNKYARRLGQNHHCRPVT